MSSDKVIKIDANVISKIKDLAANHFKQEIFLPQSPGETQIFLILKGLESFLCSQGIKPNFTVPSIKENDGGHQPDSDFS